MSYVKDGVFHIRTEDPGECSFCGKIKETRPYGPADKKNACYDCMKSIPGLEEIARTNLHSILDNCTGWVSDDNPGKYSGELAA